MTPKKILVSVLLGIVNIAVAQVHEIGISMLSANATNTNWKTSDTNNVSKNTVLTLQPVLTYNYVNKKNTVFSVQAGYFYFPSKTNNKDYFDNLKAFNYTTGTSSKKSVFIKIGIAKRIEYEKFYLDIGINIPFLYQFYGHASQIINSVDSTGKLYQVYNYSNSLAPNITTGINLQVSLYYKLNKSFRLGIDLNTGFILSLMTGRNTIVRQYTFPNSSYPAVSNTSNYDYKKSGSLNLTMLPAISLRYRLPSPRPIPIVPHAYPE